MNLSKPVRHDIQIPYSEGVLSGTLLIPDVPGQHPAVILLPGSGAADRNVPYLLAVRDHLVHHGIAALTFDKPGLGGSTGDWRHQTFYDRVDQAHAAMNVLQRRIDINAYQVGLYGISQGAWITLLAAATYPVHDEPWYHYYAIPDADMWEYFRRNAQLPYDPLDWLKRVKCPLLAIFGASDLLLPVESSVTLFQQCLAKAGNRDVTIKVFPTAGHLIRDPSTDELAPGFLALITDWLKQRIKTSQTGDSS